MKRFELPEYRIPINREWRIISNNYLKRMEQEDRKVYNAYDTIISEFQKNPLSFTLLHGKPNDGKYGNDVLDMVNDMEHDLVLLTAGNQQGKTYAGAAYCLLRLIPCEKNWPCFTQNKIVYREWSGPKILIAASYTWDKTKDLWETYRNMIPRKELGAYSPYWGSFEGEEGQARSFTLRYESKTIDLACGSKIIFLCYKQNLEQWTGKQCDIAHLDEQCPESYFDELTARQLTRGDFTPIIMTLTGHVIEGRPDTGSAGWIKQKIVDSKHTKGRKVMQGKITMESVPDALMSQEKKKRALIQWVEEPTRYQNQRKLSEGRARVFGEWEVGGGITFGEWNPLYHWIEPFDIRKYRPTYYRMIDHGQDPCACALFAVMPWGDVVMYKEYYEYGLNIEQNVEHILELCGNGRRKVDSYEFRGMTWPVYEEVQSGTIFRGSELDCRSFGFKSMESGRSIGSLYNQFGLFVSPSSGQYDEILYPLMKEYLCIRKENVHINEKIHRDIPIEIKGMGAPRLYVFNTCVNFRKEIEGHIDKKCVDHLISTVKFMFAMERPYLGDDIGEEYNYSNRETGY